MRSPHRWGKHVDGTVDIAVSYTVAGYFYRPWSLEGHRIDVKTLDDDIHTMDVGLAWKSGAKRSPAARAFCEFVALAYPASSPVQFE